MHTLGYLAGADWSRAIAVSDGDPPVVVGESTAPGFCPNPPDCDLPPLHEALYSFSAILDGYPPTLVPLPQLADPEECDQSSFARDVARLPSGAPLVVGFSHWRIFDVLCMEIPGACEDPTKDAVTWNAAYAVAELTTLTHDNRIASEARGVNSIGSGHIAGWGFDPANCLQRALYWESPTATRENLGGRMPEEDEGDASRAEAINNGNTETGLLQVVGWNAHDSTGLLWEFHDPNWEPLDLQDATSRSCLDEFRKGHDINDEGWIVGVGRNGPTDFRAYVLIPLGSCPWDITGPGGEPDGVVDVLDLTEVLSQWGQCPVVGEICWADVNGDCVVDVLDLIALDDHWGPCPLGCGPRIGQELLSAWLSAGGEKAIGSGELSPKQIAECFEKATLADRVAALFAILPD